MRTEEDLRAALITLERHAPSVISVLPDARRRPLAQRRWMPGLAAAVAAAAATAIVVAMTVTGTPARTAESGAESTALRTAILTAFDSSSDEILHVHTSSGGFGAGGAGQDVWYSPWLPQAGQQIRVRSLLRDANGELQQEVGASYTMPRGGIPAPRSSQLSAGWSPDVPATAAATTFVDYADRSWWSATNHELMVQIPDDPAVIRDEFVQGDWVVVGHPTVNGQATIELRWSLPASYPARWRSVMATWLWVNAKTYLPVQEKGTAITRIQKNGTLSTKPTFSTFQFLSPTPANLAQLQVTVPAGFRYAP